VSRIVLGQSEGKNVHDVLLGFEVGTGREIRIPLAHTFVSGQTQQSGKTTALQAIVARSGRKALAFITKRGETFEGRRIRPFLPREGDQPIHWRMVETLLAGALEQRALKFERLQIINASKGARTLEDVQGNVRRLLAKSKDGRNREVYTLLDEYLELVLPQMRALQASDVLDLAPGLNVMDLSTIGAQTQAMVIRAALERINHHETHVLTVLPEAWEFAPRDRSAPAKFEAEAMARKGAAPAVRNFLLCDSQDIAGVSPTVRQACSVWLIGVQRELNELKRGVQMMPAGTKRPKADEVATLELGQFFACWSTHAVKVYVQPAWMDNKEAHAIATGAWPLADARRAQTVQTFFSEDTVTDAEARALREDNDTLRTENAELRRRLEALEKGQHDAQRKEAERARPVGQQRPGADATAPTRRPEAAPARTFTAEESFENESLYQAFKARLIKELPGDARLMQVVLSRPELKVLVKREVLEVNGDTLRGRIARLLADGFFDDAKAPGATIQELLKRGASADVKFNTSKELMALTSLGFLIKLGKTSDSKYEAVPGMKVNIVEAA
jgi:hypothetical protein